LEQVSVSGAVSVSRISLGVLVSVGKDAVGVRLGGDWVRVTRMELEMVSVTVMEDSDMVSMHVRLAVGKGGAEPDGLKVDSVRVGETVSVPLARSDAVHVPVWVVVGMWVNDEVPVQVVVRMCVPVVLQLPLQLDVASREAEWVLVPVNVVVGNRDGDAVALRLPVVENVFVGTRVAVGVSVLGMEGVTSMVLERV